MNLFVQMRGPNALPVPDERGIDTLVMFYDAEQYAREAHLYPWTFFAPDKNLRKFGMVKKCFAGDSRWVDYDRFMIADDDMEPGSCTAMRTFAEFLVSEAHVAHPALTVDSHYAHVCSMRLTESEAAPVPFVELMAPMFTRRALIEYMPYFDETVHGWGLEQMWSQYEEAAGRKCLRLDATPWRHIRPVSETRSGPDPTVECEAFLRKYGINDRSRQK